VSEEAAEELSRILEEIGLKIARDAAQLAVFAKRKTIRAEDV